MYLMNDRRYAMNVAISGMNFWIEPRSTWEKIGSVTPGVDMMFGGPADEDVSKQIEELEMLVAQDVSGIVVFSNNSEAVAPTINKAVDKGIPVITAFADVRTSKRLAHIGTNQEVMGNAIATQAMTARVDKFENGTLEKPSALVVLGQYTSQDQIERQTGINRAIVENSANGYEMKILDPVYDSFNKAKAEKEVLEAFDRYGKIDFIFGCNSQSAIGAVNALQKLKKKPGDVVVTGWDTERDVMNQIKCAAGGRGWIHATAVLYSSFMVQVCFSILEAANFGYMYSDALNTEELRLPAIPYPIQIPMKAVTSSNVDEYLGKH